MKLPSLAVPVALLLGVSGCQPASPPAPLAPVALVTTDYFEGTSEVFPEPHAAGAAPVATSRVLVRRTLDSTRQTIEEEVVSEEGRGRAVREFLVSMAVTGASFTMTERHGAFRGTGSLEGPPWGWIAWTSLAQLPDGSTVESRDRLSDRGLEVEKEYHGPRGTVHLRERFLRIDREAYVARRKELGVAPPAPE